MNEIVLTDKLITFLLILIFTLPMLFAIMVWENNEKKRCKRADKILKSRKKQFEKACELAGQRLMFQRREEKMLKCCDCGFVFENELAHSYSEVMGECHGRKMYDTFLQCPICKGEVESIKPCLICGEHENIDNGENYCWDCVKKIQKKLNDVIKDNFTDAELRYLYDEIGIGDC